jgi:hypothetical protein
VRQIEGALLRALAVALPLAIVAPALPGRARDLVLDAAFLGGATVLLIALVRAAGTSIPRPSSAPAVPAHAVPSALADQIMRLERRLGTATMNDAVAHSTLRPLMREIASELLAARRGVALDRDPDAARTLLGESLYDLVRPGRTTAPGVMLPGPSQADLRAMIEALEGVSRR